MTILDRIGIVVIGRNEARRLDACFASVSGISDVVYVDSGSTDESIAIARRHGVAVVQLDMTVPFTAARARNAGFARLIDQNPQLKFVQTVDGDCSLADGWIQCAAAFLGSNDRTGVVFGRLRERHPNASVYNRLCDEEWNVPLGSAESSGGVAMHRLTAYAQAGRFDETLIAGEEPDLCLRLRNLGWAIVRIDADMGWHDAAIKHFWQWWRRSVRAGYAFTEHVWRNRAGSLRSWKLQCARMVFWGIVLPVSIIISALSALAFLPLVALPALLSALYLVQFFRALNRYRYLGRVAPLAAALVVVGKFAEAKGALQCMSDRVTHSGRVIIEYK